MVSAYRIVAQTASARSPHEGLVTFAGFTCQPRDALMGRSQDNQWLGELHGGTKALGNPLFLANVTMPLAANRLGCEARECVIFEDAMMGIQAATAAGARVIVVASRHLQTPESFRPNAHPTIRSYDEVDVSATVDGLILRW
jgi:hypothetical protein